MANNFANYQQCHNIGVVLPIASDFLKTLKKMATKTSVNEIKNSNVITSLSPYSPFMRVPLINKFNEVRMCIYLHFSLIVHVRNKKLGLSRAGALTDQRAYYFTKMSVAQLLVIPVYIITCQAIAFPYLCESLAIS